MTAPIVVSWVPGADRARHAAVEIAARYGGELRCESNAIEVLRLVVTSDGLELREAGVNKHGVRIDFTKLDLRTGSRNVSRKQPLGRAVGRDMKTVVDVTAGLGHDAAIMAGMGCQVTAIERNPALFALLEDGLARAIDSPNVSEALRERLRIVHGDAREVLPTIRPAPEVVYLDPMFPPRRKQSALPKKSIRLVRELVGDDDDWQQLFDVAFSTAARRVVLKRADDAPEPPIKPAFSVRASLVRYDVYATTAKDQRDDVETER